jgi:hypothetical protein
MGCPFSKFCSEALQAYPRRRGASALFQFLPVIPGHPRRGILGQLLGVFLQFGEIVERVSASKLAGVDQAHEQVAYFGTVRGLIKQTILAMKSGFLQGPLHNVGIQRRAGLAQKEG